MWPLHWSFLTMSWIRETHCFNTMCSTSFLNCLLTHITHLHFYNRLFVQQSWNPTPECACRLFLLTLLCYLPQWATWILSLDAQKKHHHIQHYHITTKYAFITTPNSTNTNCSFFPAIDFLSIAKHNCNNSTWVVCVRGHNIIGCIIQNRVCHRLVKLTQILTPQTQFERSENTICRHATLY